MTLLLRLCAAAFLNVGCLSALFADGAPLNGPEPSTAVEARAVFRAALAAEDLHKAHLAAHRWLALAPAEASTPEAHLALATTYLRLDGAAAALEHAGLGLRSQPSASLRESLLQLAGLAATALGDRATAWSALSAAALDPAALDPDSRAALGDAYAEVLAAPAWASMLERLTARATSGEAVAVDLLVRFTARQGDLESALDLVRTGMVRLPDERSLRETWLRLIEQRLATASAQFSEDDFAALEADLRRVANLGVEAGLLGSVCDLFDRVAPEPRFKGEALESTNSIPQTLPELQVAASRFLASSGPAIRREREEQARAVARFQTIAAAVVELSESPDAVRPVAWWEEQAAALRAAERDAEAIALRLDGLLKPIEPLLVGVTGLIVRAENAGKEPDPAVLNVDAELRAFLPSGDPESLSATELDPREREQMLRLGGFNRAFAREVAEQLTRGLAAARLREQLPQATHAGQTMGLTDEALVVDVMSADAWVARADAATTLGRTTEAVFARARAAEEVRRRDTGMPGQREAIERALAIALAQARQDGKAAQEAANARDWPGALVAADLALALDPLQPEALRVRFEVAVRAQDDALAAAMLRTLWLAGIEEGFDRPTALNVALRAGDWPLLLSLAADTLRGDPTEIDAHYFHALAALALRHDHLIDAAEEALAVSPLRERTQILARIVTADAPSDVPFVVLLDGLKLLDPDRPVPADEADRLIAAWLLTRPGAAKVPNISYADRLAEAEMANAALSSPGVVAWRTGQRLRDAGDVDGATSQFAVAAADPSLAPLLRATATRWSAPVDTSRPLRAQDDFHFSPALVAAGVSFADAAPGQRIRLADRVALGTGAVVGTLRLEGTSVRSTLEVASFLSLAPRNRHITEGKGAKPAVVEFRSLRVAGNQSGASRTITVKKDVLWSIEHVAVEVPANLIVEGRLASRESGLACGSIDVKAGGTLQAFDSIWGLGILRVAGEAAWRGGQVNTVTPPVVSGQGTFALSDLEGRGPLVPLLSDGARAAWDRIAVVGWHTKDVPAPAMFRVVDSRWIGGWPEAVPLPSGLSFAAMPEVGAPVTRQVMDTPGLVKALAEARTGDVIELAAGTYELKENLVVPAGLRLRGAPNLGSRLVALTYGTSPLFAVKGPGAVALQSIRITGDDTGATGLPGRTYRSVLEVQDASVLLEGVWVMWANNGRIDERSKPAIDLQPGSRLLVEYSTLRGAVALGNESSATIHRSSLATVALRGTGTATVWTPGQQTPVVADGEKLELVGPGVPFTFFNGAGGPAERARMRTVLAGRDKVWAEEKSRFAAEWAKATKPEQRAAAVRRFSRAVLFAHHFTRRPAKDVFDFGASVLVPLLNANPVEAPQLRMATYPLLYEGGRLQLNADAAKAIEAYSQAGSLVRYVASPTAQAGDQDRAYRLLFAFPPGSAGYAQVQSAFRRGLDAVALAAELAAQEAAARAAREAASKLAVERARRTALEIERRQAQSKVTTRAYVSTSSSSYSPSIASPPQWRPSQSYQNSMYRQQIERQVISAVYGRYPR